nr:MAG TPA: SOS-response transcriptional repressor [Caudoviricetes sp.]
MVLENLKKFIDSKGISVSSFEKSIGMSNNSFRKSLNSGGHIGSDKLENILKIYPELNPVWLLQGEGEMLKEYGGTSNLCRVTSVSIDEESFIYASSRRRRDVKGIWRNLQFMSSYFSIYR